MTCSNILGGVWFVSKEGDCDGDGFVVGVVVKKWMSMG